MALGTTVPTSTDPDGGPTPTSGGVDLPDLKLFMFALFFIFGGITSLNDVIIPKLKGLFTLSYAEVMLVQSAFFAAYFVVSLPAAALVDRIGYMKTAAVGLLMMTAGCLLFIPASASATFGVFLFALFVLAAGITTVQVVANPLISLLGPPRTASSRLTFGQAFNSLGTTIFPIVGASVILGSLATTDPATLTGDALAAYRAAETRTVMYTYLGLAIALALIAGLVWLRRNRLPHTRVESEGGSFLSAFALLKRPRFAFGAACIFLYVGGEVAIGSLLVNYLAQPSTMGLAEQTAGQYVAFYWGGAMVGRFVGAELLRRFSPGSVLASVAVGAIVLIGLSANLSGHPAGWTILAVGLMNSIMFPTIFSLAIEGLGKRTAEGSGIICMSIVGGAIIPALTGKLADDTTLAFAMVVPALCYAVIAGFGLFARKPVTALD